MRRNELTLSTARRRRRRRRMAAGSPFAQSVNPGDTASRAAVAAAAAAAASAKPLIKLLLKVNPDGAQERVMVGMQYPLGHLPLFLALQVRSVAVFSLFVRVFVCVCVCVCWSVRRRRSLFVRVLCVCVCFSSPSQSVCQAAQEGGAWPCST